MTPSQTLAVLKSRSLVDLARAEIEQMILDGRLAPGEQLREASLAALLGVSRGPIREAFRSLEERGLVTVQKNCGVHVRRLDADEADRIYEVRCILEAAIGSMVAARCDEAGLARLTALLGRMRRACATRDVARYSAANLAFHDLLARESGNDKLHETYRRLVAGLRLVRHRTHAHDEATQRASLAEHEAVVEAVRARRPDVASALLVRHAEASRARLHLGSAEPRDAPPAADHRDPPALRAAGE